jgi:hypothetical protein
LDSRFLVVRPEEDVAFGPDLLSFRSYPLVLDLPTPTQVVEEVVELPPGNYQVPIFGFGELPYVLVYVACPASESPSLNPLWVYHS